MNDLPPELSARRDDIHDRVIKQGRARRLQRRLVVAVVIVIAVGLPVAAVGLNTRDNETRRVEAVAPRDELSPTTAIGPLTTPSVPFPTTTTLVCRNSADPACGPLYYDPPITNEPATMEVTVEPAAPKPGQRVTFTPHVTDPDSVIISGTFCPSWVNFGEGNSTGCQASCAARPPQFGPWTPPPARPSEARFTLGHTYKKSGTYTAHFTVTAGGCSPRPSEATASVTVHVSP